MIIKNSLAFSCIIFTCISYSQPGSVDITFGTNGYEKIDHFSEHNFLQDILYMPDGKILVAGSGKDNSSDSDILLMKYNSDGTLDNTFGQNGIVTYDYQNENEYVNNIVLQNDGKILLGGLGYDNGNEGLLALRFNANGLIDSSFAQNGRIFKPASMTGPSAYGYDLALQSDGKILLGGNDTASWIDKDIVVYRFLSNGDLDSSYGVNGKAEIDLFGEDEFMGDLTIQDDDKLLIGGQAKNGSYDDFAIIRLNTDGTMDNTFSTDGYHLIQTTDHDDIETVLYLDDGSIVVVGSSYLLDGSNEIQIMMAKYNSSGTIDISFGISGATKIGIGKESFAFDAVAKPDGKINICGLFRQNGSLDNDTLLIVQCNSNGSLDAVFGTNGIVKYLPELEGSIAHSIDYQSDGKLLIAGQLNLATDYSGLVARFNGSGPLNVDYFAEQNFSLYPNPATSNFQFNFDKTITQLRLVSLSGQIVKEFSNVNPGTSIDISKLESGVYMVHLLYENKMITKKLIKN